MITVDKLISLEAEEKMLGYFLNANIKKETKQRRVAALSIEHFTDETYRNIFYLFKHYECYDTILAFEKARELNISIDAVDLARIDPLVFETEIDSYISILHEKQLRRKVYDIGSQLTKSVARGEDIYESSLSALNLLSKISSDTSIESALEMLKNVLDSEDTETITTGYQLLDDHTGGFTRGNLITIAGDSGHHKTNIALDMGQRMCERDKKLKVGIFSKEMLGGDMIRRIISRKMKIPFKDLITDNYDKDKVRDFLSSYEPFKNSQIVIIPPDKFDNVGDIAKIQLSHRFDVWIIDFIQLLGSSSGKSSDTASDFNVQVAQNVQNLKSLSLITESVGVLLSQLTKGVDKRAVKKPTVSDIEWSGVIKQLSAYIFFSYYPYKYYRDEGRIPKDYYYILGEKTRYASDFVMPMKVDSAYGIFNDVGKEERSIMFNKLRTL